MFDNDSFKYMHIDLNFNSTEAELHHTVFGTVKERKTSKKCKTKKGDEKYLQMEFAGCCFFF